MRKRYLGTALERLTSRHGDGNCRRYLTNPCLCAEEKPCRSKNRCACVREVALRSMIFEQSRSRQSASTCSISWLPIPVLRLSMVAAPTCLISYGLYTIAGLQSPHRPLRDRVESLPRWPRAGIDRLGWSYGIPPAEDIPRHPWVSRQRMSTLGATTSWHGSHRRGPPSPPVPGSPQVAKSPQSWRTTHEHPCLPSRCANSRPQWGGRQRTLPISTLLVESPPGNVPCGPRAFPQRHGVSSPSRAAHSGLA